MNRLRSIREAQGLRREDVAVKAGLSYDFIRRLEDGDRSPGLESARRIAEALGVTVDDLFPPADVVATGTEG